MNICTILKNALSKILPTLLILTCAVGARAQTGAWSGQLKVQGTGISLVFHFDKDSCTLDSPDQGVRGIPAEMTVSETGGLSVKVPSIGAVYEGIWMGTRIVGTFTQLGTSLPLTLSPGEPKLNRPQTPVGPFPYTTETVSFVNGDAVLKGTLTLPEAWDRSTPALVMVTGSGLQNRDEELFEHKPFAVIADALARSGIATLRYDDRGFGESTGDVQFCTTEDLKDDALSGIRLLRERFDKVGVIGHSEGGTIGLMLAAEGEVDFVVSLAGMVVSGEETLLMQNRRALASAGVPEDVIDTYCHALEEAFNSITGGTTLPDADDLALPDGLKQNYLAAIAQCSSPYMKYFLSLDISKALDKVTCPVLALNGSKDSQVDASRNLSALRAGLPDNPLNQITEVEGVNHLFQHCQSGDASEYREIEETFAPEVIDEIIRWLR